jgi:hypothetical protein
MSTEAKILMRALPRVFMRTEMHACGCGVWQHLAEMVVECDVPWIEPQSSEEVSAPYQAKSFETI